MRKVGGVVRKQENAVHIPYVIDNQEHRLADVLNGILDQHGGRSLDVATEAVKKALGP